MVLTELISELEELDPADKLEWLIEFADELPELPRERQNVPFPDQCRIQECQTPVHLWVEIQNGLVHLEADVPQKSPTVRGLVALVVNGLEGATISEAMSLDDDMVGRLGLEKVLGMTRQQGFRGVISRIKRELRGRTA